MVGARRHPEWLKVKMPGGPNYLELRAILRRNALHTVCEEAHCPNIGECWERRSATFMILGDLCTWRCHYCAVKTGRPHGLDLDEPGRLAHTVEQLALRYCVITSVTRDDLPDGGASLFAQCIHKVREHVPTCQVEVLIPDLTGRGDGLKTVLEAGPTVLNHNIESVERIFKRVRPKGEYRRSLDLLRRSSEIARAIPTKSGIMVGLGEGTEEVLQTMRDLRSAGVQLLTIGQYLRPSPVHAPMHRHYHPDEFAALREAGLGMGFRHVASGPLVRSSYHADEQARAALALST
ncbi:MAG: lipoyl synthase [SAR202 cluster bacterium]|nr:lipoyl synthase [SAR202 cluster bacterium]